MDDDLVAEKIEKFKEALIWITAEYLHTVADNPGINAWDLAECKEPYIAKYKNMAVALLRKEDLTAGLFED
jgi:hypothetical protein